MDGFDASTVADAIVVGAGLTGLACAVELQRLGLRVMVLEASRDIGGVVGTSETNGFLFEAGPNTVPASAAHLQRFARELGIDGALVKSRSEAKRRYLFVRGALHEVPTGPRALLRTPLLSWRGKRRILSEPLRKFDASERADEPTVEQFLTERVGAEATRLFAGAFVRGIHAAEIDELGARSAFPRMYGLAASHGGLVRGMFARMRDKKRERATKGADARFSPTDLVSFGGGFGTLVDACKRKLDGCISTSTPVLEIDRGPGGWRAVLEGGEALACRELVLAIPAGPTHPLVAMCAPERLDLDPLRDVEHASITAVNLGLESAPLPPGFGFLVPPDEEERGDPRTPRVLGMLFTSNLFDGRAPSGTSSITAMYRGGDVADLIGDGLVDRAVVDLEKALIGYRVTHPDAPDRSGRPRVVASRVQRWTGVIPRYAPGHAARMSALVRSVSRTLPGLHLAGTYRGGVSVDDRLCVGRDVAASVAGRLAHLSEIRRDATNEPGVASGGTSRAGEAS